MKKSFTVAALALATADAFSAMANGGMFAGTEFGKAKMNVEGVDQLNGSSAAIG